MDSRSAATLTIDASNRFCSLVYVLWSSIYYTGPVGNCFKNEKGLGAFYPASVSLSALLFFFRVRIVYEGHKWIVGFFFFMWLAVVGGTLTVGFGVTGVHIGPTNYCLNAKVEDYVAAAALIPLIYDTSVFLAITYRLAASSHLAAHKKGGWWARISGDYLPGVSRGLLKDGQTYYMVTVFSNLLTVIMIYMSSLPATYRTIFSAPNIMLINVMACRVFRHTKFAAFRESTFTNSTSLATNIKNAAMLPVHFRHTVTGNGIEETTTDVIDLKQKHSSSDYKSPATPYSGASSGFGIEFTRPAEEHAREDRITGYPPHYPSIRKYPSSDTRF
ncbi:hypothetical protein CC2G_002832 [Coprinopsis cinerea AmutBmut pab1-1]|nr:hypothetical protein CC2G_002832 [Coprinopsis cinerea AmutBmut pab1-1]